MKNFKKHCFPIVCFFLFLGKLTAQNFNYTLSQDSSVYTSLESPTTICKGGMCSSGDKTIDLPFLFSFCGKETRVVNVEANGALNFKGSLSLSVFNQFTLNGNSTSSISYKVDGASGHRIVKIQYQNLAEGKHAKHDYLSYQIWLYENGNHLEIRVGENYASTTTVQTTVPDSVWQDVKAFEKKNPSFDEKATTYEYRVLMALINKSWNTPDKAYCIEGAYSSPKGKKITGDEDLSYVKGFPSKGMIYKLTPSFK